MKILVTGAKGMLAKAILKRFKEENLICTDIEELDITNKDNVELFVKKVNPNIIINCAAYTDADKAESEKDKAYKINAIGTKNLAIAAKNNNAILIHISTDYVFDGKKEINLCYDENDKKKPQTVYGKTKLLGEQFIVDNCYDYYIFRTAWLYGEGKNFVRTIIKLASNNIVKVVNDQYGSPTYTEDLADIIYQVIEKKIPFGIYNATNLGYTTWYEFTKKIYKLKNINCKVIPIISEELNRAAKRPLNTKLSKEKLLKYGIKISMYEDALERYLKTEK